MGVGEENLREILLINSVIRGDNSFLLVDRRLSVECNDIVDPCNRKIIELTKYGLNNGFENVERDIVVLTKAVVDIYSLDFVLNKRKAERRASKIRTDVNKLKVMSKSIEDVLGIKGSTTLNISQKVIGCIENTIACNNVYCQEVDKIEDSQFSDIKFYLNNPRNFAINDWKNKSMRVIKEANEKLEKIKNLLAEVVDDSSKASFESAEKILSSLKSWRDSIAYAYLTFDDQMNDVLVYAKNEAEEWSQRKNGVSRDNPRADVSIVDKLCNIWKGDQMSEYVCASK